MLISLRLLFGLDAMQYLYNAYIPQVFLLVPCEDNAQCNSSTSSSYLAILHLLVLSICPPRGTMSSDNTSCLEQSDVCKLSAVGPGRSWQPISGLAFEPVVPPDEERDVLSGSENLNLLCHADADVVTAETPASSCA